MLKPVLRAMLSPMLGPMLSGLSFNNPKQLKFNGNGLTFNGIPLLYGV